MNMTKKEMEQQMLNEINKYKPLIAAIGCCKIAKNYAQQEIKKLAIHDVSDSLSMDQAKEKALRIYMRITGYAPYDE